MDESFLPEEQQNIEVIEKEKIRISVRNLVEFVFRSGDIDNRVGKGVQKEAMQQGSRMHRKIQKRMGAGYRAEVPLKHEVQDEEQEITLLVEDAPMESSRKTGSR